MPRLESTPFHAASPNPETANKSCDLLSMRKTKWSVKCRQPLLFMLARQRKKMPKLHAWKVTPLRAVCPKYKKNSSEQLSAETHQASNEQSMRDHQCIRVANSAASNTAACDNGTPDRVVGSESVGP